MIILRGANFECKVSNLTIGYDDCSGNTMDYTVEYISDYNLKEGISLLDILFNSVDYENIGLNIGGLEDYEFNYSYDSKKNILTLDCILIDKRMLYRSIEEKGNIEVVGEIKDILNKKLPIKYKHISYKEFKEKFNISGTKKQLKENCPDGCYFDIQEGKCNNLYILNKNIYDNNSIINYSCQL